MRTIRYARVVVLLGAMTLFAVAGPHEDWVKKETQALQTKRDTTRKALEGVRESYMQYGLDTNELQVVYKTLSEMDQSSGWRDLASRETRTKTNASAALNGYLRTANQNLKKAQEKVAIIKKAEFDKWARDNPGAAKMLELEKRVRVAEANASFAQFSAKRAQEEAQQARQQAQQAQEQAQQAEWDAQRAKRRTSNVEDKLQQHGIEAW